MNKCKNCGKDIENYDAHSFCNWNCYMEYRRAHPEEYGQKTKTYQCAYCGKEGVKRKPSEARNNVYCSRECSNKAQSQALANIKNIDTSNGVRLQCEFCNSDFFVKPHRAHKARFCSRKCSHDHRANRPLVIKKPRDIKGSLNPNFRNWSARSTARANAIEKMGHQCVICGFDIIVHVHHIVPVAAGGSNDIDNLIVLCPNHHEMADRGMVPASQLIALNPFAVAQQSENQHPSHQLAMFEHSTSGKELLLAASELDNQCD